MRTLVTVLSLLALGSSISDSKAGFTLDYIFGCKEKVCVIPDNLGGLAALYEFAADEALKEGVHLRIGGKCYSGCVIFASRARANVCLSNSARIGIHMGEQVKVFAPSGRLVDLSRNVGFLYFLPLGYRMERSDFVPTYGEDVVTWALANDKMPPSDKMYILANDEAKRFWKSCDTPD